MVIAMILAPLCFALLNRLTISILLPLLDNTRIAEFLAIWVKCRNSEASNKQAGRPPASSKEDIAKFAKDMGVNYPILLGKEAVGDAYGGVPALPESFFIGRDGKLVDKIIGLKGKGDIEEAIQKALNTRFVTSQAAVSEAAQPQK